MPKKYFRKGRGSKPPPALNPLPFPALVEFDRQVARKISAQQEKTNIFTITKVYN
jgi:hypothetical protein